jgi:uncharacterized protein YukE
MMSDQITVSYEGMMAIQDSLTQALAEIRLVANSAFVTDTMFLESKGSTAEALNNVLRILAGSSTAMSSLLESTIAYLDMIVAEFSHWDEQAAIEAYWVHGYTPANLPTEGN